MQHALHSLYTVSRTTPPTMPPLQLVAQPRNQHSAAKPQQEVLPSDTTNNPKSIKYTTQASQALITTPLGWHGYEQLTPAQGRLATYLATFITTLGAGVLSCIPMHPSTAQRILHISTLGTLTSLSVCIAPWLSKVLEPWLAPVRLTTSRGTKV
jgi:hypothetical protein